MTKSSILSKEVLVYSHRETREYLYREVLKLVQSSRFSSLNNKERAFVLKMAMYQFTKPTRGKQQHGGRIGNQEST